MEISLQIQKKKAGENALVVANGVDFPFCWIPPGEFMMGSLRTKRQHKVVLTDGFWLLATQVTQKQWFSVTGESPSRFQGENRPVESVSWFDCQEYVKRLNALASQGTRFCLPTEAEWEYACRAGTTGDYGGTGDVDEMGWYNKDWDWESMHTRDVAQKKPNAWGLYDMHGNVDEWCEDRFGRYPKETVVNPTGSLKAPNRVVRVGGYFSDKTQMRSFDRWASCPNCRSKFFGLRLAMKSF
jgi:formylglycine-generating enzyme required for sulfatase activity